MMKSNDLVCCAFLLLTGNAAMTPLIAQGVVPKSERTIRVTAPALSPDRMVGEFAKQSGDTLYFVVRTEMTAIPFYAITRLERGIRPNAKFLPTILAIVGFFGGGAVGILISGNSGGDVGSGKIIAYWIGAGCCGYGGYKLGQHLQKNGWEQVPLSSLNEFSR